MLPADVAAQLVEYSPFANRRIVLSLTPTVLLGVVTSFDSFSVFAIADLFSVLSIGFRPPTLPRDLTATKLAQERSRMRSRSNSAMAPTQWSESAPAG